MKYNKPRNVNKEFWNPKLKATDNLWESRHLVMNSLQNGFITNDQALRLMDEINGLYYQITEAQQTISGSQYIVLNSR